MIKLMCFDDNTGEEIKEGNIFTLSISNVNMDGTIHAECDDLSNMIDELTFSKDSMLQIIKAIRAFGNQEDPAEDVEEVAEELADSGDPSEENIEELAPVSAEDDHEEKTERKVAGNFPLDWGKLLSLFGAGVDMNIISSEMGVSENALRNALWRFRKGQVDELLEKRGIDKECIEQAKKACGIK